MTTHNMTAKDLFNIIKEIKNPFLCDALIVQLEAQREKACTEQGLEYEAYKPAPSSLIVTKENSSQHE